MRLSEWIEAQVRLPEGTTALPGAGALVDPYLKMIGLYFPHYFLR
jgi:hypothetical protein